MVDQKAEQGQTQAPKYELAPILYHLAGDPAHARLRAVNEQDLARLKSLLGDSTEDSQLLALWHQAWRWRARNQVHDPGHVAARPLEEAFGALSLDAKVPAGYFPVWALHSECYVCSGEDPDLWGFRTSLGCDAVTHCAAHTAAFHAVVPNTWHCCDPPYHPAHAYAWRAHDPRAAV